MKKLFQSVSLFVVALGLMGCPYESHVPITRPNIPVRKDLLGHWSSKDEVYHQYTVTKASEYVYGILQENTLGDKRKFKGHVSEIKGGIFMNLHCDSLDVYYLYRIQMDAPTRLVFIPIEPATPRQFHHSESLQEYVEKNMNLKSFYNEGEKLLFEKKNDEATLTTP